MAVLGDGVKRIMFETAASWGDWRFPVRWSCRRWSGTQEIDEVVLGRPDYASWDDYGWRHRLPAGDGGLS